MCGIAGIVSVDGADQSQLKLVAALLAIEIQARGTQSFGTLDNTGTIVKGLGAISAGLVLPLVMPRSYVMHTRFGTHGANIVDNAHPFTQGNVIGVHNGVLGNHHELNSKYGRDFEVDSQHIFQHINDGLVDLSDIEGYGAIVYRFEGKWFAGTFNHGQLEIANTHLGKIYASTADSVRKACRFAGVDILSWDKLASNTIYELQPVDAFKRFDVCASGTTRKWDDDQGTKWWQTFSKKNESGIPEKLVRTIFASSMKLLPAPDVEAEEHFEHDASSTGLSCEHCYNDCLPELYYVNVDGQIVCADCAKNSYAFIAPDEYYVNENRGRFQISCGLCNTTEMEPIINLVNEDLMICKDCFEIQFNTKGLTKVTPTLVN